jgi:hypothetical protein
MIRIRPTTQNVEVLEKLAGVKQGTAAELTQLFVDHDFDIENFQLFEIVSGKPDNPYHVFDQFKINGWGWIDKTVASLISSWGLPIYKGETRDSKKIEQILACLGIDTNGVKTEENEGISWG